MSNHKFPTVRLTGGPLGRDVITEVDGARVSKVTRVEAVFDVHDVARVTTFQLAEIDVTTEALVESRFLARAALFEGIDEHAMPIRRTIGTGEGATVREALQALLDALPEELR